jgi:outer membrane protein, heavy metal efflux system
MRCSKQSRCYHYANYSYYTSHHLRCQDWQKLLLYLRQLQIQRHTQCHYCRLKPKFNHLSALIISLNGGNAISLTTADFPAVSIPSDFKSWYAEAETKSPALAYARQEAEVANRQVAITRADGMPKLTVGFTGEYINDENLSGFSVGMTIPLWSNKNKVKQAKAEAVAAKAKVADAKLQFYYNLQSLYQRQAGLHEVAEAYNQTVNTSNNMPLLKKALNEGAISVTAYITDLRTYYELKAQHLDATRSWHKAVAELLAITM